MDKEKYYYLVSYVHKELHYLSFSIGRILIARTKEIETFEEIKEIEKEIKEQNPTPCEVTIISWEELKHYEE